MSEQVLSAKPKENPVFESLCRDYERNFVAKNKQSRITLSVANLINLVAYQKFGEKLVDDQFNEYALTVFKKWLLKLSHGNRVATLNYFKAWAPETNSLEVATFIDTLCKEFKHKSVL